MNFEGRQDAATSQAKLADHALDIPRLALACLPGLDITQALCKCGASANLLATPGPLRALSLAVAAALANNGVQQGQCVDMELISLHNISSNVKHCCGAFIRGSHSCQGVRAAQNPAPRGTACDAAETLERRCILTALVIASHIAFE